MNRWILLEILGLWKFLLIIIDINYVLLGIIEMIKNFSRVVSAFQSGLCNILAAWLLTRNLASLSFGSSYIHFPYNPISKKLKCNIIWYPSGFQAQLWGHQKMRGRKVRSSLSPPRKLISSMFKASFPTAFFGVLRPPLLLLPSELRNFSISMINL